MQVKYHLSMNVHKNAYDMSQLTLYSPLTVIPLYKRAIYQMFTQVVLQRLTLKIKIENKTGEKST